MALTLLHLPELNTRPKMRSAAQSLPNIGTRRAGLLRRQRGRVNL